MQHGQKLRKALVGWLHMSQSNHVLELADGNRQMTKLGGGCNRRCFNKRGLKVTTASKQNLRVTMSYESQNSGNGVSKS